MKILFQGDSVTDAGRDRSNPQDMGEGYPKYASAMIQDSFPDVEFEFYNLGISGHRTEHLVQRLQSDFVDIQADIVSVLIGINDVWHHYAFEKIETTDADFEANLKTIFTAIKETMGAKLLVVQPFLLDVPDKRELREELNRKQAILARLCETYADAYLPMDEIFAGETAEEPTYYAADGVHPTSDGACYIGEAYLKAIIPLIESFLQEDEQHKPIDM